MAISNSICYGNRQFKVPALPEGPKMPCSGCSEWNATATAMRIARKTPVQKSRVTATWKQTRTGKNEQGDMGQACWQKPA
eukprot:1160899-Pelagomonas_calceolata.AAC.3